MNNTDSFIDTKDFIDADTFLSSMRKGELLLVGDIHHIYFDDEISREDLHEIEERCRDLGYSYTHVAIIIKNKHPFFVYPMKRI